MDIKDYIHQEQVRINQSIDEEIATLHSHIQPIARHIFSTGGKRLRPLLIILIARHFGYNHQDIYKLAIAVELIHSATLLHDDILDNSSLRRGITTAHTIYGPRRTILAGDALLAKGCHLVASTGIPSLLSSVSEIIMDTVQGEIEEIACEEEVISYAQYLTIIQGKTAKMIQKACEMGAIRAGASTEDIQNIGVFGEQLGMAFQIVDDILDYTASDSFGKPRGIDIKEGKITAPLLLYQQEYSLDNTLLYSIAQKKLPPHELDAMITAISTSTAIDKSYALVQEYIDVALQALSQYPETQQLSLLKKITLSSIQRAI